MRFHSLPWAALALSGLFGCSARGGQIGNGPVETDVPVTADNPAATDNPPPPDSPVGCASPRTQCGSDCVDTQTSPANCGRCGMVCGAGQSCSGGTCMAIGSCTAPRTMCGSLCADTAIDPFNCGRCGTMCATGQSCTDGRCTGGTGCTGGQTMCASGCVDTLRDATNCGSCGNRCPTGQSCTDGTCAPGGSCASPRTMCSGVCVDPNSDPTNCGTCGRRCATGQTCSFGTCTGGTGTSSPAGNACTSDATCGALTCDTSVAGGICTDSCMNSSSQATEQSMCGGARSTCLSGNETTNAGFCTRACDPNATSELTGACRAGWICSGLWTGRMTPDVNGCLPFCTSDVHCSGATPRCDVRVGSCSATGAVLTRLPDGSACDPTRTETPPGETTPRNTQCRGRCFRLNSARPAQGICGSFINLDLVTSCPDDPTNIQPRAPMDDNLGVCIFRECTRNANCGAGLICIYPETAAGVPQTTAPRICQFATAAQPAGVP